MKRRIILFSVIALAIVLLLTQCKKKDDLELSGTASAAGFTFLQVPPSDTLPLTAKVIFTNTSTEEFLYQWNFGDGSALSSEKKPVHQYKAGGAYNVTLTTVGTNGNNSINKVVGVVDACANAFFQTLTNCDAQEWTWSTDADAIRVLSPDATQVYFSGAAGGCQADDIYTFTADGTFKYDAKGQTFDVQAGYSCQVPKANAQKFKIVAKTGQLPKIFLDNLVTGTGKPFIGTTDVVDSNLYKVQSFTNSTMVLRATIAGSGGVILEVKFKKVVILTLADIKNLLTGGNTKNWKLDNTPGAKPIIVGTEANPSQYFAGGALDTVCQSDDVYTFTSTDQITYNANGATFNGGNITPNYNCGIDRSFNNVTYTFGPTTGGVGGIATIKLPSAPPTNFIGTTDVPSENVYRIIDISNNKMTLRAGNGSGTIFQFKFIAQ